MFITPPRFDHSALERKLIASAVAVPIDTPYGRIAAWRVGDLSAPAVVLCHGWGGRGAQLRGFVAPLVNAGYQVVFFDHLGHGMSDGRQAALVDFWRGVEAVWDALIDRGITVHGMVSHSLGGAAVASALRRSLTRKHINAPTPRVVLIAPPASLIRYSKMFARYIGITERIRRAMQWRFEQRYGVSWEEFELPQSVESIVAPALFIHDRDDRETKFDGGLALAKTWPGARFVATSKLGHRRILRDSTVIHHAIDFLADRVEFRSAIETTDTPAPIY
jgi:pimeloyl-ACP methyl ester carboxylesterase